MLGIKANMPGTKRWGQEFRRLPPTAQLKTYEDVHEIAVKLAAVLGVEATEGRQRRVRMTRAKKLKFAITKESMDEAIRNAMVFGNTTFSPVFVAVLRSAKRGFPLVGGEEVALVDTTVEANELRRIYIRDSKQFDAGKITAEQFRNDVQPLFDNLTEKKLREQQN
jgi:hypothetical protein